MTYYARVGKFTGAGIFTIVENEDSQRSSRWWNKMIQKEHFISI